MDRRPLKHIIIEKILAFPLSLKYHIFIASSLFLYQGKLTGGEWVAAITIIAGLKEGIKAFRAYNQRKYDE